MFHFIRDHAGFFHIVGMIGYVLVLFWFMFVGARMVYLHHIVGHARLRVAIVHLLPAGVGLLLSVFFYSGAGVVTHPITELFMVLFAILGWLIAVLTARQRFAAYAAADLGFPGNI